MYNQNSPIIQNMINTGQFGYQYPNQPYMQYGMQQQPYYNTNQQFVFQPIQQQYQQQYYGQPQMINPYTQQQPKYDYYDPYKGTNFGNVNYNHPYLNYGNNPYQQQYQQYGQGYYNNGYMTPIQYSAMMQNEKQLFKLKCKIAAGYKGITYTEEELEALVNPQFKVQQMSQEELQSQREFETMKYYNRLFSNPPTEETNAMKTARLLRDMSYNYHKELDNHSLATFLRDDLWKLQREFWIKENVKVNDRSLASTYSSSAYNELLSMHRSNNPYVNELLDTSRYDNNIDDMEIGLPAIMEEQRRRKNILEGRVPTFVSSDEAQKRRHEFTNAILSQIYSKGGS